MYTIDWLSSLDSIGFQVFRILISVLWQSSILLGAIGILAYLFKLKKETAGYFLWVTAIIIIPSIPLLTRGISISGPSNFALSIMPPYYDPHTRVLRSQLKQKSELKMRLPVESNSVNGETVNTTDRFVPLSSRTYMFSGFSNPDLRIIRLRIFDYKWALFFIGYFSVAALFLIWELIGMLRIRRWIVHGSPVTDSYIIKAFQNAKNRIGLSKDFKIIVNKHVSAPMTTRIHRPIVILPEGFAENLSVCELQAVAIHELSHIKRNDVLIFSVIYFLRAVFFFFPLVWVAARQISYLAEIACDNMVVVHTGEKVSYAKFLTRLAEKLSDKGYSIGTSAGIFVSKSIFYRRIEALLSSTGKRVRKLTLAAIAGFTATISVALLAALAFPLGDAREDVDMLTITGNVVFEGKTVTGAEIYFSEQWSNKAEKVARSGVNGAFEFEIQRSKLIHPNRSMPAIIAFKKNYSIGWINIKNAWDVNGLTVRLNNPETVTGTVVDPDGAPVRGAAVSIRGLSTPHFGSVNEHDYNALYDRNILPGNASITDRFGRFVIYNIPEGIDVAITCKRGGYAEIHRKNIPAGIKDMVVSLNPGASIEGRLSYGDTGKPARNITLNIGRVNSGNEFIDYYSEATTDFRGNYRAENLPPGNYTVFLRDQLPDWTAVAKTRIKVEKGKTAKSVDLSLIRGGFVTGRILDKDTNKPLARHLIRYSDESHPPQKGFTFANSNISYTDENGFYCFRAAPGKVTISTTGSEGYEIYYLCKTVEISDNVTIAYNDFHLKKAITVTGRVLDLDGTAAIGMHIKIPNDRLIGGGYAGLDDYVTTDFEGRFTINGLKECESLELKVYDSRGNFKNTIIFYVKTKQDNEFINKPEYSYFITDSPPHSTILSIL
ncbi:M56 family metallopeptidase [Candidatus Latescibacterota bacterium]